MLSMPLMAVCVLSSVMKNSLPNSGRFSLLVLVLLLYGAGLANTNGIQLLRWSP